jgi:hypothetical protein
MGFEWVGHVVHARGWQMPIWFNKEGALALALPLSGQVGSCIMSHEGIQLMRVIHLITVVHLSSPCQFHGPPGLHP